jgi:hypothetical protein
MFVALTRKHPFYADPGDFWIRLGVECELDALYAGMVRDGSDRSATIQIRNNALSPERRGVGKSCPLGSIWNYEAVHAHRILRTGSLR